MNLRLKLALTILAIGVPIVFATEKVRGEMARRNLVDRIHGHIVSHFEEGSGIETCNEDSYHFGGVGSFNGFFFMRTRGARDESLRLVGDSLWAYDIGFGSDNPDAPPFPDDLRAQLVDSKNFASIWRDPSTPMSSKAYWGQYFEAERKRWTRFASANPDSRRRRSFPTNRNSTTRSSINRPSPSERRESRPRSEQPDEVEKQLPFLEFALLTSDEAGPCAVVYLTGWAQIDPDSTAWWWLSYGIAATLLGVVLFGAGPIVRRIRMLTEDVNAAAETGYAQPVRVRGNDEIARLATAFNAAGDRIKDHIQRVADREASLRQFVANTTHDVMIPLTVLQGHLTNLGAHLSNELVDARTDVAKAAAEAHYLGSILQNLSAVSKLEHSDYQLRNDVIRLDDLVERVVARHEPIARKNHIEISHALPGEPVLVRGDVTLLEQAVSNVVHNAVRYNEAEGHVAVLLDVHEHEFSLRVIDDGKSLSADDIPKLPERRFRGESARTRNPDGLGLGLHIAHEVMRKHDFTMTLQRSEYGGLEVVFTGTVVLPD